jgi:hypothetical protein
MTIPILIAAATWLAQQPAPQPRAANVEGTVVNTLTAHGIGRAMMILRSQDTAQGTSYAEETDANGQFRINDVAPGEYSISADRQGFFAQPNGAPGAPPPRITVAAGEQVTNVVVKLTPTGVINGRVLDQDGEPVRGAMVHAMQFAIVAGQRQLRSIVQVQSKENGEFRLFGLRPGSYRIQVSGQTTRAVWLEPQEIRGPRAPLGYAPTFFPSTVDAAGAVPVELKAGAELRGFDITVRITETGRSVRAKYSAADNVSIQPQLIPLDRQRNGYGQSMHSSGDTIEFTGVLPGSYILLVTRVEDGARTYARQEVEVGDADVDAGTLYFSPAADIHGTVRIEGKPSPPLPHLRLSLQPVGPSPSSSPHAEVKPDGSFVLTGVTPSVYQIALTIPTEFYIKSIRSGDAELPDRRLDVTRSEMGPISVILGADVGRIEGVVVLADGNPAPRVRVTLFPDGAHTGRPDLFKFAFTDDQGSFHFDKIPPGDYRLFAWQDVQPGEPQDPEFRKKFEKQSALVKLGPNSHETVPLTAIVTMPDDPR